MVKTELYFLYPSTSFSGATALIILSVLIVWMESRGSWTMSPWILEFSLTSITLRITFKMCNTVNHIWQNLKQWLITPDDLPYLIFSCSLWKFHMYSIDPDLKIKKVIVIKVVLNYISLLFYNVTWGNNPLII